LKTIPKNSVRAFTLVELMVTVVVVFVVGAVLVDMLQPVSHSPGKAHRIKCVNNLKQIGLAFAVFEGDHNGQTPFRVFTNVAYQDDTRAWAHFQGLARELQTPKLLLCPDDKTRLARPAKDFSAGKGADVKSLSMIGNEAVSYFLGINANATRPASIVAADRSVGPAINLPAYSTRVAGGAVTVSMKSEWSVFAANRLHDNQGDLLLGDGSVQQASVSILQNQLKLATNSYGTNFNRFLFQQ